MSEDYRDDVPLESLHLDAENPRLHPDLDPEDRTPERLLKEFARRYNLLEIARSIADKGFSPRHAEALLVVADPQRSDEFVVVEGNRRLATVLLLTSSDKRDACGLGPEWQELADHAKAKKHDLAHVPVVVYDDRRDLDDYLGFRHITGPTPWRPEAKARFIAKLLRSGKTIDEVVRRIGSNHRTVRRYAEAYAVFSQANEAGIDTAEVEKGFGVFYNALDWAGMRDFLGLGLQTAINTLPDKPVPPERRGDIAELIELLFGDDEKKLAKVIDESRDLRKLSDILLDPPARSNLLRDRDLERAWRTAGGGKADLIGLLKDLYLRLAEVTGQSAEYGDDDDVREQIKRIQKVVLDMSERYKVDDKIDE